MFGKSIVIDCMIARPNRMVERLSQETGGDRLDDGMVDGMGGWIAWTS
jgi:hypothetical protein